eukprot:4674278-Heterocapsa_arctica.AAC.1
MERMHIALVWIILAQKKMEHMHIALDWRKLHTNTYYISLDKNTRGLNTSHHIDETTNNAGTHHWHIAKPKSKHFYCTNLRRIGYAKDFNTTGQTRTKVSIPGTMISREHDKR